MATDPIYMPFFQSLHRSRPPTALEKKMKRKRVDEPNDRTTARSLIVPLPEGKRYIGRCACAVGVRVEFDLRGLVAVVVGSAQSSARPCEHVHHRCARDDASTLLRACHGCLKRSSGGEQGEAQRGLHHLINGTKD